MKPNKYEEKKMYSGMYFGMTIAMYILGVIMRMWSNNISCFVLQNTPTWLTSRERINSLD